MLQKTPMKALRINTDGTYEDIELAPGLKGYYDAIGCQTFDMVRLSEDCDMWVDDEGLLNGSELNLMATALRATMHQVRYDLPLMGNAVLTGGATEEGDTLPLSAETREVVIAKLERIKQIIAQVV